jgi:DNA-binding transcriptional MerR regulator
MMQQRLSISKFAQIIGVTPTTLRRWDKSGVFSPAGRTPGGKRFYTKEQAEEYLGSTIDESTLVKPAISTDYVKTPQKQLSISKFAQRVGVTVETLRKWDKSGELVPAGRTQGGHRFYTQEQLDQFKTENPVTMMTKAIETTTLGRIADKIRPGTPIQINESRNRSGNAHKMTMYDDIESDEAGEYIDENEFCEVLGLGVTKNGHLLITIRRQTAY